MRAALEDADSGLPDAIRPTLAEACDEIRELEARIAAVERHLEALARETPVVPRCAPSPASASSPPRHSSPSSVMPPVSPPDATSPASRIDATGVVDRVRRRLGAISKRGDSYLRMLLIHGARSVLCHAKKVRPHDRLRTWALDRELRRGHNKAAVALANKLARIVWAVWTKGVPYQETPAAVEQHSNSKEESHRPTADCSEKVDVMAHRFGPTRGEADNYRDPMRSFGLIGSPRADSIMARSTKSSMTRPKIRLQSNSIA